MGSLFKILVDTSNDVFALAKVTVDLVIDNTINGIASFSFKDSTGKATMPQLNVDGALPVTFETGVDIFSPEITHLKASQTKNNESLVGTITIDLSETYSGFVFNVASLRVFKWRAAYVDDAAGTPVETDIGFGYTDAGELNVAIDRKKTKIDTNSGTGVQEIRLYTTPLDKTEDVYAQFYFTKL